jgi:hypothetical protein
MPALTIGVVSPKVRVIDVENMIQNPLIAWRVTGAARAVRGLVGQDGATIVAVEALFDLQA